MKIFRIGDVRHVVSVAELAILRELCQQAETNGRGVTAPCYHTRKSVIHRVTGKRITPHYYTIVKSMIDRHLIDDWSGSDIITASNDGHVIVATANIESQRGMVALPSEAPHGR